MKNLDIEKIIIALSILLMPVAGWWIWSLQGELGKADIALRNVGAIVKECYGLQKLIDQTKDELSQNVNPENYRQYFERRLAASNANFPTDEMRINETNRTQVRSGRRVIGEDIPVKIEFKGPRGGKPLTREFINAFVFNCESKSPIWKLRNLKITNTAFKGLRGNTAPPGGKEGMGDNWTVDTLVFARRKPKS